MAAAAEHLLAEPLVEAQDWVVVAVSARTAAALATVEVIAARRYGRIARLRQFENHISDRTYAAPTLPQQTPFAHDAVC